MTRSRIPAKGFIIVQPSHTPKLSLSAQKQQLVLKSTARPGLNVGLNAGLNAATGTFPCPYWDDVAEPGPGLEVG
jgi:hypothetical protein